MSDEGKKYNFTNPKYRHIIFSSENALNARCQMSSPSDESTSNFESETDNCVYQFKRLCVQFCNSFSFAKFTEN